MRIVCPNCAAAYEVPEALLGRARPVRCARCGERWLPEPETPADTRPPESDVAREPAAAALALPRPPAFVEAGFGNAVTRLDGPLARLVEPPPPQRPRRGTPAAVAAGWLATLLFLAALGWAALNWRDEVMHAWPPSARLYTALGLDR